MGLKNPDRPLKSTEFAFQTCEKPGVARWTTQNETVSPEKKSNVEGPENTISSVADVNSVCHYEKQMEWLNLVEQPGPWRVRLLNVSIP